MSDMMRFPVGQMHAAARRITTNADTLGENANAFWQRAQGPIGALPPAVREGMWECLSLLRDHVLQVLDLQRSLANHLDASADLASATDHDAATAFDE